MTETSYAGESEEGDPDGARTRIAADAARLAEAIASNPGIGVRHLRAHMRAQHGSFSIERLETARCVLGTAVVEVDGGKNSKQLYLEGSAISAEVLNHVPLDARMWVTMSAATPEVKPRAE